MKSGRGGFRKNAGRKTGWASGRKFSQTKIIRVPTEFANKILEIAHKLDAGEALDPVTNSEADSSDELSKEIDLVTESKEQRTIDIVQTMLSKWRQLSNQAKITSPKTERWAKARQMLDELEPIVFGEALLPKEVESKATVIASSLVPPQIDLVTKAKKTLLI